MSYSGKKERSRSPDKKENAKRWKDNKSQDDQSENAVHNMMNQQMMLSNMYQQGNMMFPGMFPNMMMTSPVMSGPVMTPNTLEIMSGTNIEIVSQNSMEIAPQTVESSTISVPPMPLDMNMMGGVMLDPSMMGVYAPINTNMSDMHIEKNEIILKSCKLVPPLSGIVKRPSRPRPPNCRTLFIGGLPDKIRESTIRDIFERYGRILTLRFSNKNFCHIRYDSETSLEAAMSISGYRIILTNGRNQDGDDDTSQTNIKYLNIDYAMSRDDRNEYERNQRQTTRQEDINRKPPHFDRESEYHGRASRRYPSPPKLPQPFSTIALIQLTEKIKNEDLFAEALLTLIAWLERGECCKKNSSQFYSMLQSTNSHIRRLMNEKMQAEDEFNEYKEKVKRKVDNIISQLEQVAKVFAVSTHQRVWDHFTKPQRKNIESWLKMTQFFSNLKEEFIEKFCHEELDNDKTEGETQDIENLKHQNESLKFQLEAYRNEIDIIKQESQSELEKFKAQFIARNALQGVVDTKPPIFSTLPDVEEKDAKINFNQNIDPNCGEAKLIGILSAFLQVHPMGASLDYVMSYVRSVAPAATQAAVHRVLQRHPDVFRRAPAAPANPATTPRWTFVALRANLNSHN